MKNFLSMFAALAMLFTSCGSAEDYGGTSGGNNGSSPANDEIWYTSTTGDVVAPFSQMAEYFGGVEIVSNTYKNGKGVVKFSGPVTKLGNSAFYFLDKLKSIQLPNSITEMGTSVFNYCRSLTSVTLSNNLLFIDECSFMNCEALEEIVVPNSVTTLGESVFENCKKLKRVTLSNKLTAIPYGLFYDCQALEQVTLPESVTAIGSYAFFCCYPLTEITIPANVAKIDNSAFKGCMNLKSVYCKSATPPQGNKFMFSSNAEGRKIYVPKGSLAAYQNAEFWSDYKGDIVETN